MTPATALFVKRIRGQIAEMQRELDGFQERDWRILDGERDFTEVHMRNKAAAIAELERFVEEIDPDGFTKPVEWPKG